MTHVPVDPVRKRADAPAERIPQHHLPPSLWHDDWSVPMPTDRSHDPLPSRPRSDQLDRLSIDDHEQTEATEQHWQVARHLWRALTSLDYTSGHLLAIGADADLLAGRPPHRRRHDPEGIRGIQQRLLFHSPVPPGNRWPHRDLTLRQPDSPDDPHRYDVIIANLPGNDVMFADPGRRAELAGYHGDLITGALQETTPGGMTVALAAHAFMDDRGPGPRDKVAGLADLAGAVRLPQGSLRPSGLCYGPIDLLLLRRRPPGADPAATSFTGSTLVPVDGTDCYLNEYWQAHPENMAGYLVPSLEPTVATLYTSEPDLDLNLPEPVDQMITAARAAGLTAPGPDTSSPAPGTQANTSTSAQVAGRTRARTGPMTRQAPPHHAPGPAARGHRPW